MRGRYCLVSLIIIMFMVFGSGDDGQQSPNIKIPNWGPSFTQAGKPSNVQPSGKSAIWFQMSGTVDPKSIERWFGNNKIADFGIESDKGGWMQFDNSLIAVPWKYPVYLMHVPSKPRIDIGIIEVQP